MADPVNQMQSAVVDRAPGLRPHWPRWLPWRSRCLGCGDPVTGPIDLCADCSPRLPWNRHPCPACAWPLPLDTPAGACPACRAAESPLTATIAPLLYAAPVDRWQPRFKFRQDLAAGRLLGSLLAGACAGSDRPDAIVPVPLHRARLRARGFDQALELAKILSRTLRLPLHAGLLLRSRATEPQSRLAAEARHANLRGAFAVRAGAALPAHVALVDDVMTTGATLHAAGHALRAAGAARVDAWVCARVP